MASRCAESIILVAPKSEGEICWRQLGQEIIFSRNRKPLFFKQEKNHWAFFTLTPNYEQSDHVRWIKRRPEDVRWMLHLSAGGGIAVQHRMAFQGEYFVGRHGAEAAERTPPIRRMLEMGTR